MADNHFENYKKELDKLNLKTVNDLEALVKPLIKDAAEIILKKKPEIPNETHLQSHFGGQPYFEKGEKWPVTKNGNSLEFVFQIFNTGNRAMPENIKLVQFYYDFEEFLWNTKEDGWLVKIYEKLDKDNAVIIKKPEEHETVNYCEIEYKAVKSLPDWEGIDSFYEHASMLSCVLDEEEPWGNYQKIAEKLIGEQEMKSRLGGYANWVQGNENPEDKDFQLLFQIDSEENAGLMWGDTGLIYVFYNCLTKKTEFVLQCY
jgi:uncharacterized protein YwqG